MMQTAQNVESQPQRWDPSAAIPKPYPFDESILTPKDTYHPGDPFLIVSVDSRLMKDHNDIANAKMIHFLIEYIQFCHAESKDKGKE